MIHAAGSPRIIRYFYTIRTGMFKFNSKRGSQLDTPLTLSSCLNGKRFLQTTLRVESLKPGPGRAWEDIIQAQVVPGSNTR